ncbi:MAG: transglutaminase domain-containing protein, partial [Clostridia bacterium]|nr:transglutaminase domain-containing protein [Clostridia bacterium]
ANLYLRGWIATEYRDGMWHSGEDESLEQYRRVFGTAAFVSEQMRVNFYRAVAPEVLSYTDYVRYYQNHLDRGFITMQVNMRRVGGGANMVFAPAYFNPEIGLVNYGTGDPSNLSFINYYDGIHTGRSFIPGADYGAVSFVTSMRDSTFMDTLSTDIEAYAIAFRAARAAWPVIADLKIGDSAVWADEDLIIELSYDEPGYAGTVRGGISARNGAKAAASIETKANAIFNRFLNMTAYEREELERARELEERYRSHVYGTYVSAPIPRSVQDAVGQAISSATAAKLSKTAEDTADARSAAAYAARHGAVIEIVRWLSEWVETGEFDAEGNPVSRRRFNYTLNPTVPPDPSLDGVENFLSVTHEGYCVQFASAAVLMLRSLGIPARYVEGYIATDFAPAAADSDQRYLSIVRDSNAHAWVEVYYDGIGWLNYEATPAYVSDMYAFGEGTSDTPGNRPISPDGPDEPEEDIFDSIDPEELLRLERERAEREAREHRIRIAVTALAGALALTLLILSIVIILRRTHRADRERLALLADVRRGFPDDEEGRHAARSAARRLIDEVEFLLVIIHLAPAVGEQRSAYARRLAPEFGPLCPIPIEELFDAMGAEEFGSGMSDDALSALGSFRAALGQAAKKRIGFGRRLFYRYIKHLL